VRAVAALMLHHVDDDAPSFHIVFVFDALVERVLEHCLEIFHRLAQPSSFSPIDGVQGPDIEVQVLVGLQLRGASARGR
jgi:hypothetical protein